MNIFLELVHLGRYACYLLLLYIHVHIFNLYIQFIDYKI